MLIAIEGCLGVGKSTVAKGLAACRRSELMLEEFESNPFLKAFYRDPVGTATETEFAFLLLHFHQLKANANKIAECEVISDFHLGKDLLYADLNLVNPRVKNVFGDLFELCDRETSAPTLLILLSSTNDLLIDRIRERNRDFEQKIDPRYYAKINSAYEAFFRTYPGKKIKISMNDWDFVRAPKLYESLSKMVDGELNASA
jgi:deoxyadenosine/deoxycytidine kinase